jgi:peptidoglycan-associated lipoprotein
MNQTRVKWVTLAVALAAVLTLGACKKKLAPPPPPPPPAPTASLKAVPETIQRGEASTLTWTTANATDTNIEGIGSVEAIGSRAVSPTQWTTFRLIAKGPGGTQQAVAHITVTEPPPPPVAPSPPSPTDNELFQQNVKSIFFDFDKYNIGPDQEQVIRADAQFLVKHPNITFTIEGHCDERGSIEYNVAVGDNRANAAKQALVTSGVSADHIHTISYGKERPVCTDHDEECWQRNRRAQFEYRNDRSVELRRMSGGSSATLGKCVGKDGPPEILSHSKDEDSRSNGFALVLGKIMICAKALDGAGLHLSAATCGKDR